MKIAALDLGTNTFLCLLAEGKNGKLERVEKDLVEVVRLGQDVQKTGEFHKEALIRADECLSKFNQEIIKYKPDRILAVATSAARDVSNGQLLFDLGKKYKIPIQIIDGDQEALTTFRGSTFQLKSSKDQILVVDIGGGSTELILGKIETQPQIITEKSLNIGAVRLTEKFITKQPIDKSEIHNLEQHVSLMLKEELDKIQNYGVQQVIAVAGTPTSIAALELGQFIEEKVDGFWLDQKTLQKWVQIFSQTSVEEKRSKYGLGGRADIIFAGTQILLSILKELNLDGVAVSTKGVRYGVALQLLSN